MSDPAKVKFRVIDFELSGSDEAVRDSIRTLTTAFSRREDAALPAPDLAEFDAAVAVEHLPALPPPPVQPIAEARRGRPPIRKTKAAHSAETPRGEKEQRKCANPDCGALFTPKHPKAAVCKKVVCRKWKASQYAKDVYARKHPHADKAAGNEGEHRRMFTHPGPPTEPPSAPLPPGSEHGAGFSMSELHGMGQAEALTHWAKRHHNLLDVSTAVPMLQASGVFGSGNHAAVRNRILNLIDTLPAFSSSEAPMVFELNS